MKEKQGEHPFGDTGQIIAFIVFMIIWVSDSFFLNYSTALTAYIPLYARSIAAFVILVISLWLLGGSHKAVAGDNRPERVMTKGVFGIIRHPLYMSALLFYLVLIVSTLSLISLAFWVIIFVFYNYIAGYEEKLMEMKFGEKYISYKRKTSRWLPRI